MTMGSVEAIAAFTNDDIKVLVGIQIVEDHFSHPFTQGDAIVIFEEVFGRREEGVFVDGGAGRGVNRGRSGKERVWERRGCRGEEEEESVKDDGGSGVGDRGGDEVSNLLCRELVMFGKDFEDIEFERSSQGEGEGDKADVLEHTEPLWVRRDDGRHCCCCVCVCARA